MQASGDEGGVGGSVRSAVARYIEAFNRRDLETLAALFDEDVTLEDWAVAAYGKAEVLALTRQIVTGGPTLEAVLHQTLVDGSQALADLTIVADGKNELAVIDLFRFTPEGLIASIRAFQGPARSR